jgi:pyruvate dehydrogenase E1 component beta subunit
VKKTGRLLVIDGGWKNCGIAGEVIASVVEKLSLVDLKSSPQRVTLPDAPAPTSRELEKIYYPDLDKIINISRSILQ